MMALVVAPDPITKKVDKTTITTNQGQDLGVVPVMDVPGILLRVNKLKIATNRPARLLQDKSKKVFLFLALL
jgi:hypothetical protein